MKRTLAILVALTLVAAALGAAEPQRRTIVIRNGKVLSDGQPFRRGFLGVSLLNVSPQLREHFGSPKDAGVLIQSVTENSPAAKSGLRVGDVITAIDGKAVDSSWDVTDALTSKKGGDSVRIDYVRGRSKQTAVATVEERDFGPAFRNFDFSELERDIKAHVLPDMWRAHIEAPGDCGDLQTRIRDLEGRLQDLEKKLQK